MMDGYCSITCGVCGQTNSVDAFCRTPIFGDMPKNQYQCPACHLAIERRMGESQLLPSGFVMPGKMEIVAIQARM